MTEVNSFQLCGWCCAVSAQIIFGTYVAISVVCLVMAAVIISLNGLVIFILARQKDSNRLHFFIFHLAIAVIIVSNNLLIGMSVDRYLAVRYPLRTITG
ncbi:hypothetical protein DPMN_059739, partial [Dreissena polymorpha]